MKKKDSSKMVASVILGIMTVLLLTLNLWGKEWYKLLISLVVGVITGVTIYDYHAILQSIQAAWKIVGETIEKIKLRKMMAAPKPKRKFVSLNRIIFVVGSLFIFAINYGAYFILSYWFFSWAASNPQPPVGIKILICALIFALLFMIGFLSLQFKWVREFEYSLGLIKNDGGVKKDIMPTRRYFLWGSGWHLNLLYLLFLILFLCYKGILLVIVFFLGLLQSIFSVPLAIGLIFKTIGQNEKKLLITISIVAGGLIGTFIGSYVVGITSGLIILGLAALLKNATINLAFFFKNKANLAFRFYKFAI